MTKAAATGHDLSQNLSLFILLNRLESMLPVDAASLCYSFTVGKSGSGPWKHQVQGQLNEETFIYCDSTNCHANGVLGNRLNATKSWGPQVDPLKDGVDLFKQQVVYMKQENDTIIDTHSLSCNVIVKVRPTPRRPWCEGQCSVDGESFLQYDNDNKATALGDLGKAAHATQVWTDLIQRLEYLGQELRKILANTKQETAEPSGHPTLQAIMLSKYERGQIVGASWQFNVNGKYSFILNTMNMSWTPFSLEAGGIMNDEQLIKDLKVISTADCSHWLKELLKLQKEKPRPTSRTLDITQLKSMRKISSNKESIITAVVLSIIILLIVICICMCVKRKCCPQGEIFSCP